MSSRAEDLAHPTQPSSSVANAPNSPYSRVYNAATNAAQPLLGYLAGAAGVAMAAAGDPGALSAVTSGVNVDAAQADRPVTRTASVPSSSSVPGAQSLGTADEETRRKDIRNLDNIVAVGSVLTVRYGSDYLAPYYVTAILCQSHANHHTGPIYAFASRGSALEAVRKLSFERGKYFKLAE